MSCSQPRLLKPKNNRKMIWDAAVFRRLKRVSAAGGELSAAEFFRLLEEISTRHSKSGAGAR